MKRSKRIYILLGVLVVACAVTFGVSRYETHKEQIQNSDEIILEVASDSVESLSWETDSESLAFHKDENWIYDDDENFPVDEEKINELLEPFQEFGVSFVIEDVDDLAQYGLTNPVCTIQLGTAEQDYTILVGDYSTMDSERYVSIGDGNVYLVPEDPMDEFDAVLSDMIDHDEVPSFEQVTQIQFSGDEEYQISYEEDSADTYREEDVYFTELDGVKSPLDTSLVDSYLQNLESMDLTNYVTYNATQEDLEKYGLDAPELTISVEYTFENEDEETTEGTFVLNVSRDPNEQTTEESEVSSQTTNDESQDAEEETEEITAYARVGESPIVYQITTEDYNAVMKAAFDDLRHKEVVPAEFEDISQIDISLDGESYTITTEGNKDERTYYYGDQELEIEDLQNAVQGLQADSFTQESPTQKEEISFTVHLDLENEPSVEIQLYRYDGSNCLAVVNGESISLVPRESVVDLIEAVNSIVLN
ncbi:DUF4340 domain-containing protein [uncultured Ruthenibacterium sp.]|uniref:DUF4340 domain-containing protein n=1 Tax=uncultured Ruthenibacterium sp. TaxID=1905347 RepID=UPI00349E78CD